MSKFMYGSLERPFSRYVPIIVKDISPEYDNDRAHFEENMTFCGDVDKDLI